MRHKIILIYIMVAPYRTPLFNEMWNYFREQWYDFKVIFTSEIESNRKWDIQKEIDKFTFDYEILNSKQLKINSNKDNHFFHFNFDFNKIINKEKPDIIIHTWWASLTAWQSCLWCKKNKAKYILWNESTKYENSWRRTITKPVVKYLVRNSDAYISFGSRSKEYLEILWANKNKIFEFYNTVDIDFFVNEAKKLKPIKEELKHKYWIKTKYVLLFVWQLIERKWIYEILSWFEKFKNINNDISLIFVWWWQEKENLEKIIKENNINDVFFPWFFQIDKIWELYAIADIFTLPSIEEVWGLVINEAMCFWLPILTAYKVWASPDLVIEWKNGFIMKEYTWDEFEKWIKYIFDNNLIEKNNSLEIINKMRIANFIKNLKI